MVLSDHLKMRKRLDSKKVLKRLGLKARELRNKKGWTLEECEEHGWTNWRHLQTIESGKNITVETVVNLANLYNVSISDLFDE